LSFQGWTTNCELLSVGRGWPTLPEMVRVDVAAGACDTLIVSVAVPDSAAAGVVPMDLSLAIAGHPIAFDSCEVMLYIRSPVAALPTVVAHSDEVSLSWQTSLEAGTSAEVHLSRDGTSSTLGTVIVGADGRCAFVDHDVTPGSTCSYWLAAVVNGVLSMSEVMIVNVPAVTPFALSGLRPNPSRGAPVAAFTLARRGNVRLELFDLSGRRVWDHTMDALAPGPHLVPLDPMGALRSGLYIIRLTQGDLTVASRGMVLR